MNEKEAHTRIYISFAINNMSKYMFLKDVLKVYVH